MSVYQNLDHYNFLKKFLMQSEGIAEGTIERIVLSEICYHVWVVSCLGSKGKK